MGWVKKATLQVADDATTADLVGKQSRTQRAVDGRIQGVAVNIITSNPTVVAATAAAVSADIAGRDLVLGSDRRVLTADNAQRRRVIDSHGNMSYEDRADGTTFIADPVFGKPVGGGAAAIDKVRLLIIAGQSNAEGRALPIGARIDPQHQRLFMWHWGDQAIRKATVPLSSQQQQVGFSLATQIARRHVAAVDETTAVVVLNAAAGGSGLVAEPPQGSWKIDYAGANPHLYEIAIAEITKTKNAIATQWPGAVVEPWIYWHQGEADGLVSYGTRLEQLINALRTHLGDQTIPWTSGGLVPEVMTGGHFIVREQLIGSQSRNLYCAYTDGIPNSGGSQSVSDTVHMAREGAMAIGDHMFDASMRAATATATVVPHKPLSVSATFINGTLTAKWSEPLTRFTNFVVEYRLNGGSWVTATRLIPEDVQQVVTGLSSSAVAEVRVSSVNATLTSEPTTPVTALGA